MTTVIVNKNKNKINVYSDRLYSAKNTLTNQMEPENNFLDIKSIKVNDDLILFSTGDMALFMTLSIAWRQNPDYLAEIKDKDMLLNEIVEVSSNYTERFPVEQLYALFIVSKDEVLDLNIGLNINPAKPVSIIPTEYKITNIPQIYGGGREMFKKPNKLNKLLKRDPKLVFDKISRNPKLGTSKEFDTLSIDI